MWGRKKEVEEKKKRSLLKTVFYPLVIAYRFVRHPIKSFLFCVKGAVVLLIAWFFLHPYINKAYLNYNQYAIDGIHSMADYLERQRPENDLTVQAKVINMVDVDKLFLAKSKWCDGDCKLSVLMSMPERVSIRLSAIVDKVRDGTIKVSELYKEEEES